MHTPEIACLAPGSRRYNFQEIRGGRAMVLGRDFVRLASPAGSPAEAMMVGRRKDGANMMAAVLP
jgi:hypothetical protein